MKDYKKDVKEVLNNKMFKKDAINFANDGLGKWCNEDRLKKILLAGFKDFYDAGGSFDKDGNIKTKPNYDK